ncbi:LacI family DNA-binding transcriptional regulator [Actinomycetes bacterium KLBMP 9759]
MVTIKDVAKAAGVSPSTVSRVLTGDTSLRVGAETRARIVAAAERLRYTPSRAARAVRGGSSGAIGFAVHDISNPVYAEVIRGAQRAASRHGLVVLLADVEELARDGAVFASVVRSRAIDGLLLLPAGVAEDRTVAREVHGVVPAVVVADRQHGLSSVSLQDRPAAELATRHLLDLGHTDIAHLQLDGNGERGRDRLLGWRTAMGAAGLTPGADRLVVGGHTAESGRAAVARLLRDGPPPTGIVAATALTAVGALSALRDAGLGVPHDVSVISIHDVFFAEHLSPPLTAVRLPMQALGEAAVELLVETMGGAPRRDLVVEDPPELVVRGTSGAPG